jgi:hypothetical protein
MTTKEKLEGLESCPHCGALLDSRHARRQHLTLRVCQGGLGDLAREQIINRSEPRERTEVEADRRKRP